MKREVYRYFLAQHFLQYFISCLILFTLLLKSFPISHEVYMCMFHYKFQIFMIQISIPHSTSHESYFVFSRKINMTFVALNNSFFNLSLSRWLFKRIIIHICNILNNFFSPYFQIISYISYIP